jgi:hypothetical protein
VRWVFSGDGAIGFGEGVTLTRWPNGPLPSAAGVGTWMLPAGDPTGDVCSTPASNGAEELCDVPQYAGRVKDRSDSTGSGRSLGCAQDWRMILSGLGVEDITMYGWCTCSTSGGCGDGSGRPEDPDGGEEGDSREEESGLLSSSINCINCWSEAQSSRQRWTPLQSTPYLHAERWWS